jgi:hypothetical protein
VRIVITVPKPRARRCSRYRWKGRFLDNGLVGYIGGVGDGEPFRDFAEGLTLIGQLEGRFFARDVALDSGMGWEMFAEGSHGSSWELSYEKIKGMRRVDVLLAIRRERIDVVLDLTDGVFEELCVGLFWCGR